MPSRKATYTYTQLADRYISIYKDIKTYMNTHTCAHTHAHVTTQHEVLWLKVIVNVVV